MVSAYDIRLPSRGADVEQDEEWFEVVLDGEPRRIRIHDYHELYSEPRLYDQLLKDELHCSSPQTIAGVLATLVRSEGEDVAGLRVLDMGAGSGMLGEELAAQGARSLVGVDIIPEAAQAAERDHPGLYEDYLVADLADLAPDERRRLEDKRFNCLTLVAALSFDDVPPQAFAGAYNLIGDDDWIAFNVKQEVLQDRSEGIGALVRRMRDEDVIEDRASVLYLHRMSVNGDPLYYVALMGRKRGSLPLEWLASL
jgi:SAM-dependent methyltransferase